MIEAHIESYFKRRVRETGGEERKVVWPGRKGAPDRLAGWPNGRHGFVELKRPGGKAEAHQLREHERLRSMGIPVDVLDTKALIDAYVEEMSGRPLAVEDLELSIFTTNVLGPKSDVSIIAEILDDPTHPKRRLLRARDLRDLAEIRKNVGL